MPTTTSLAGTVTKTVAVTVAVAVAVTVAGKNNNVVHHAPMRTEIRNRFRCGATWCDAKLCVPEAI